MNIHMTAYSVRETLEHSQTISSRADSEPAVASAGSESGRAPKATRPAWITSHAGDALSGSSRAEAGKNLGRISSAQCCRGRTACACFDHARCRRISCRCSPGAESSRAEDSARRCAAVDAEHWSEIAGTLAGDDTVLIITPSRSARAALEKRLKGLLR